MSDSASVSPTPSRDCSCLDCSCPTCCCPKCSCPDYSCPNCSSLPYVFNVESGECAVVLSVPYRSVELLFRQRRALERAYSRAESNRESYLIEQTLNLLSDIYETVAPQTGRRRMVGLADVVRLPAPEWHGKTIRRYAVDVRFPHAGRGLAHDDASPEVDDIVWYAFSFLPDGNPIVCVTPTAASLRVEIDAPSKDAARRYVEDAIDCAVAKIASAEPSRYAIAIDGVAPIPRRYQQSRIRR